ncbi:MAG: type II secretion system F family protein [Rubripirellula sp.]|nr:type II secretion system F family protein [Rubripirellula sp.]
MDSPFLIFYVIASTIVIIAVVRWIRRRLIRGKTTQYSRLGVFITLIAETITGIAGFGAIIFAVPHPMSILILGLAVVSMFLNAKLRYQEETGTLNRCVRLAHQQGMPLSTTLNLIGETFRSRLGARIKKCADVIQSGESEIDSVRLSRLPIAADTLALMINGSNQVPRKQDLIQAQSYSEELDRGRWTFDAQISSQLTYLGLLLLGSCVLGEFTSRFILPFVTNLEVTLSMQLSQLMNYMDSITLYFDIFSILFITWLVSGLLLPKFPQWLVGFVPWFGRSWIDRQRTSLFRSLARGMRGGTADDQLLLIAADTCGARWIASRCRKSASLIDAGGAFVIALRQSGLIRSKEDAWLATASATGNLPTALEGLASSVNRRLDYSWQLRATWLIPLILILIGLYALANLTVVFSVIYQLVSLMA